MNNLTLEQRFSSQLSKLFDNIPSFGSIDKKNKDWLKFLSKIEQNFITIKKMENQFKSSKSIDMFKNLYYYKLIEQEYNDYQWYINNHLHYKEPICNECKDELQDCLKQLEELKNLNMINILENKLILLKILINQKHGMTFLNY